MMTSTLSNAAEYMHGTLHGEDVQFRGVSTDTRSLRAGELFVALHGPNFDGEAFLEQAASKKAAGAVISHSVDAGLSTIVVDDTLKALGDLGAAWRGQMPATVIGITGSNGKTTLKELLSSCLSMNAETLATHGNLNNEIGVPLMLLRMRESHRYAVIEMGANHHGEIGYLTSLAAPRVVAITNAAPAHLEGFGSVEGVAKAKSEILTGGPEPDFAVLNADDDYFEYWKEKVGGAQVVTFGLSADADFRASQISPTGEGYEFTLHMPGKQMDVRLSLAGKHNVLNACAAAAIAHCLGVGEIQIREGLEAGAPVGGRLQPVESASGAILFDDSYNANPVSVQAAAEFLAAQEGESWLVLGDMAELGGDAELLHAHTGWVIREAGISNLLATGPLSRKTVESFGEGGHWFETVGALNDALRQQISMGDVVLVKGSRSMGMERVVHALVDKADKARSA
ncbi:MAG: UDP-N-acetylmuramoyl-tripeptide--D-alanyl-D-alanine ligase [Woeseiaceae bacterium]|nr:UDP-N-acetylmuramoyl-tripeptide--D-alanyl-D-alanine ligase [Woeseiaceae bacterium]